MDILNEAPGWGEEKTSNGQAAMFPAIGSYQMFITEAAYKCTK